MAGELAAAYHSGAQRARVVTESWGEQNFYCPNCNSPKLNRLRQNTKASDFRCPDCQFWFQLKGQKSAIGASITDGAYRAMMEAIRHDEMPSFYFMHYDLATWSVRNLLLVPHFAFPPSAIIKRKPLSPTARRAGWVGCNFDLSRVPVEARISVVAESAILPATEVREQFRRVKPLQDIAVTQRGWTLDVLTAVRRLVESRRRGLPGHSCSAKAGDETPFEGSEVEQRLLTSSPTNEFATADVYAFARELEKLHPDNRHVRDKIRQQLQVLRDAGLLLHVERGVWKLP
ncbi:MAG: DpnI domain-containing protein [Verrucomicrobiota bacterium]|jgi:type II restriction enzyme